MKRATAIFVLLVVSVINLQAEDSYNGPDYFPLRVGMRWDYYEKESVYKDRLVYSRIIFAENEGIYNFKCIFSDGDEWYQRQYRKENAKVYQIYEGNWETLFLDMRAKEGGIFGEEFETCVDPESGETTVSRLWRKVLEDDYIWVNNSIKYTNCLLIQYVSVVGERVVRREIVFAPNMGIVQEVAHNTKTIIYDYKPF